MYGQWESTAGHRDRKRATTLKAAALCIKYYVRHSLSSAHHLFSLLHHLLVALLEFTHLARLLGILLHPLVELLLVDNEAEAVGLSYGNDVADQVVVAQSARVVVEPEEQHQWHEVQHHEFHTEHLRSCRCSGILRVVDFR